MNNIAKLETFIHKFIVKHNEFKELKDKVFFILMDVNMPKMQGYAAATKIRKMGCKVPIVAFSVTGEREVRDMCARDGFDFEKCFVFFLDKHSGNEDRLFELIAGALSV